VQQAGGIGDLRGDLAELLRQQIGAHGDGEGMAVEVAGFPAVALGRVCQPAARDLGGGEPVHLAKAEPHDGIGKRVARHRAAEVGRVGQPEGVGGEAGIQLDQRLDLVGGGVLGVQLLHEFGQQPGGAGQACALFDQLGQGNDRGAHRMISG
jgi:hypothetical protein